MRRFLAIVAAALSIAACSQTGGVEPAERQARADGLVRMTTELPQQQAEYHHFDFLVESTTRDLNMCSRVN